MNYQGWTVEYQKFFSMVEKKIEVVTQEEQHINMDRGDGATRMQLSHINAQREFLNSLVAFLINTENAITELENSNRHLATQNFIYHSQFTAMEKVFETEFGKKIYNELRAKTQG
jgi:hypothetical protein